MTRVFAPLFACLLALVLATTSITMAVARSANIATQTVVICAGYGATTIELDAEGNPAGPVHLCPECTLAFITPDPTRLLAGIDGTLVALSRPIGQTQRVNPSALPLLQARGPPLLA
jgi:hypothetical protein